MLFRYLFLISIIGFTLVSNVLTLPISALEPSIIQSQSSKFIVKIGGDAGGTGFFVRKNNNRYTILTNRHVVENSVDQIVTTSDGKLYNFSSIRPFPGLDLAEIEIESEVNYPVATLSNKSTISPGSLVYTYGWNAVGTRLKARGLQWLDGKITGQLPIYNSSDGYSLGYTLALIHGLSGSPLLNQDGEVIGIYGSGEENSIGLGIPIANYKNVRLSTYGAQQISSPTSLRLEAEKYFKQGDEKYDSASIFISDATESRAIFEKAITDFDRALKIDPKYQQAYLVRGMAKSRIGRKTDAIADFSQVILIDPTYANAHFNSSLAKYDLGDVNGAISQMQKAEQLYKQQNKLQDRDEAAILLMQWSSKATFSTTDPKSAGNLSIEDVLFPPIKLEQN